LNTLQAVFTPLLNDEAYYWLCSQNIAWGFFDHPPLTAFLIKLSSFAIQKEIGVRLFFVVIGSITFYYLTRLLIAENNTKKNYNLVFLLIGGSLFLNSYSFLALPDTPLLCFGILFFWYYRKYLKKDNFYNAFAFGIIISLLLYSKYHGILIIGFTILAYPKILKRRSFYLSFIISLILYTPHIYWLIENDFSTIRFHLFERSNIEFDFRNSLNYLGEQLALTGPVILLLLSILYKPVNTFQKVLKINVLGIFLFFFFSSFISRTNTHWTAIAWLPMICLSYLYLIQKETNNKLIEYLLIANFIIVMGVRLNLAFNWFSIPHMNDLNPVLASESFKDESDDKPLVFINMYNEPALYMFYNRQNSFAINTIHYKRTHFNYWKKYEEWIQGKSVNTIGYYKLYDHSREITIRKGKTYYLENVPDFRSFFTSLSIDAVNLNVTLNSSNNYNVQYRLIHELKPDEIELINDKEFYVVLHMINDRTKQRLTFESPLDLNPRRLSEIDIIVPEKPGFYECVFSIRCTKYPYLNGFNSKTYFIQIK